MDGFTITPKIIPDLALEIHASEQDVAISETEGESSESKTEDTNENFTACRDHAEVTSTIDAHETADCNGGKHTERGAQVPESKNVTPDTSQNDAPAPAGINQHNERVDGNPAKIDNTRAGKEASAANGNKRDNI